MIDIKINGVTYSLFKANENNQNSPQVTNKLTGENSTGIFSKELIHKILIYINEQLGFPNYTESLTSLDYLNDFINLAEKGIIHFKKIVAINKFYSVMQRAGASNGFEIESKEGIILAPLTAKGGFVPPSWKRVDDVIVGDIIFSLSGQKLKTINVAIGNTYKTDKDRICKVEYHTLLNPVDLSPLRQDLSKMSSQFSNAPFNINGTGNQGYLFDTSDTLANYFINKAIINNPNMDFSFLKSELINFIIDLDGGNNMNSKLEFDKNLILYGPPGTGKTFNSKRYAVAICEDKEPSSYTYDEVEVKYDSLSKEGRIAFTTFHQSYGYEEFIEGIKPKTDNGNISYDVENGVFKSFCENARVPLIKLSNTKIGTNPKIWKFSINGTKTNSIKNDCYINNYIRIGFNEGSDEANEFIQKINKGDLIIVPNSKTTIEAIGVVEEDDYTLLSEEEFKISKKVSWLVKDINEDILSINNDVQLSIKTLTLVPNMKVSDLIEITKKYNSHMSNTVIQSKGNFVFIIDEINRGNMSKIFGELITLIEDSKREGESDQISAILPYSNERFSIPSNVYILGTMNTADRSIAMIDTALRRRFQFIEKMPDCDLLSDIEVNGLNIKNMLEVINKRIEVLYDREHMIGHAFFIKLKQCDSNVKFSTLSSIFKNKIIPLLCEYFHDDMYKVQLILGDNAKSNDKFQFIKSHPLDTSVFNGFIQNEDELPEVTYSIQGSAFDYIESYKEIVSSK
ncbi:MAG: McrB family protein [Anaeroplasmataceae bacterium]